MTEVIKKVTEPATDFVEAGVETLKSKELYYGIAGVAAASLVGGAFTMLPFDRLPMGNVIRTGSLLIGGAAIVGMSRKKGGDIGTAGTVTGTLMAGVGVAHVLGYIGIPGFKQLGDYLKSGSSAFGADGEFVAQPDGSGRVIGQFGANYDVRPMVETGEVIAEDDDFVTATVAMQDRFAPQESQPVDSVMEGSTMAGTITQNFGAETISTGYQAPNDMGVNEFVAATDALARGSMDKRSNPFVASITPVTPSYQPQVWYAEDVPTMEVTSSAPAASTMGGMEDLFGTYIRPSNSGEDYSNPFVMSAMMPSAGGSGHGVTFDFGAEGGF